MSLFGQIAILYHENDTLFDSITSELEKDNLVFEIANNQEIDHSYNRDILDLLLNEKAALKQLFQPDFMRLLHCLDDDIEKSPFPIKSENIKGEKEKIQTFLKTYRISDLKSFVKNRISNSSFNEVHSFLVYKEYLPKEILEIIKENILNNIAIAELKINSRQLVDIQKIINIFDPFLYKIMNVLGVVSFEPALIEFFKCFIEAFSENTNSKLSLAMKNLDTTNPTLLQYLSDYKNIKNTNTKGKESKKSKKNINGVIATVLFLVFCLIGTIIFIINFSEKSPDYVEDYAVNSQIQEIYDKQQNNGIDMRTNFQENVHYLSDTLHLNLFHEEKIAFNNTAAGFREIDQINSTNKVELINTTNQNIVVYLGHGYINYTAFLLPQEHIYISEFITYLTVYTGKEPQIIRYMDSNGEHQEGFRFKVFSKQDSILLHKYDAIRLVNDPKKYSVLTLEEKEDEIILNIENKEIANTGFIVKDIRIPVPELKQEVLSESEGLSNMEIAMHEFFSGSIEEDKNVVKLLAAAKIERERFRKTIMKFHGKDYLSYSEENRIFEIENTGFTGGWLNSNFWKRHYIINKTNRQIIVHFTSEKENLGELFLSPFQKHGVHISANGFVLYSGRDFRMVEHEDNTMPYNRKARFKTFTEKDENLLRKYDDLYFDLTKGEIYTFEISIVNNELSLEIIKK